MRWRRPTQGRQIPCSLYIGAWGWGSVRGIERWQRWEGAKCSTCPSSQQAADLGLTDQLSGTALHWLGRSSFLDSRGVMDLGCPSKTWEEESKAQRQARRTGLPGWALLGSRHHILWPQPSTLVLCLLQQQSIRSMSGTFWPKSKSCSHVSQDPTRLWSQTSWTHIQAQVFMGGCRPGASHLAFLGPVSGTWGWLRLDKRSNL